MKIKYVDWFGTKVEETTDTMIWRIKSLQEKNTRLQKELSDESLQTLVWDKKCPNCKHGGTGDTCTPDQDKYSNGTCFEPMIDVSKDQPTQDNKEKRS